MEDVKIKAAGSPNAEPFAVISSILSFLKMSNGGPGEYFIFLLYNWVLTLYNYNSTCKILPLAAFVRIVQYFA